MSVASPQLLKAVTFKDVTQEQIGGSVLHSTVTGIADFLLDTDEEVIAMGRELVTYIPLNHREKPPLAEMNDDPGGRKDSWGLFLRIFPGPTTCTRSSGPSWTRESFSSSRQFTPRA